MKSVGTYYANIYVGLKEGYDGPEHSLGEVYSILQEYCDTVSYAVTVTPTTFIYKNGSENGVIIGLINYPRFPSSKTDIVAKATEITCLFKEKFKQQRISFVCPDATYMIE